MKTFKIVPLIISLLLSISLFCQSSEAVLDDDPPEFFPKYLESPSGLIFKEEEINHPTENGNWILFEMRETGRYNLYTISIGCISDEVSPRSSNSNLRKYSIYPNPTSTEIIIEGAEGLCQVGIYNIYGQNVKSLECSLYNVCKIDITDLTDGVYFVHIKGESLDTLERIIIK